MILKVTTIALTKRIIAFTALFTMLLAPAGAQEMWGIVNSNFAGSNGTRLNPSSISTSKLYQDVNILTADIFADNNYLYIHGGDYSVGKLWNNEFPVYEPEGNNFDWYRKNDLKNVYLQIYGKGPSFFQTRGRHSFALHTGMRVLSSVRNVSYDIANFGYNSLDYVPQHNIRYNNFDLYMNAMGFMEVGATYSYGLYKSGFDDLAAGITVKALFGYSGGYAYVNNIDYIVLNDSTANVLNLDAEAGFSIPIDYDNNDYPDGSGTIKGNGAGIDLGFTYQRKVRSFVSRRYNKLCQQRYVDYIYKLGVSLIDVGYVRFNKNTEVHAFEDVSRYWYNVDTISYYNMNALTEDFSRVFYGTPDASYRGDAMSIWLPMAFSVQFDYHYVRNWYVNATFIHPVIINKSTVHRPTQIAVTPRFETPEFEAALPVSLYDWKYPRIGLALRYHILTVGTDRLGTFFGFTDLTGADIYFSVKINFSRGRCHLKRFIPCENDEYGPIRRR